MFQKRTFADINVFTYYNYYNHFTALLDFVRDYPGELFGMIDDHDECEWVNVSSGTGSPGLSRTNSTEP